MPDELRERFRATLAALVDKHELNLTKKTTLHSRWLAWWLWGDYQRRYRYCPDRWLAPPKEEWRLRSRLEAFEHLLGLPTSLVQSLIESWREQGYARGVREYARREVE